MGKGGHTGNLGVVAAVLYGAAAAAGAACPVKMQTMFQYNSNIRERGQRSAMKISLPDMLSQQWAQYGTESEWAFVEYTNKGLPRMGGFDGRTRYESSLYKDSPYSVVVNFTTDTKTFTEAWKTRPTVENSQPSLRLNTVEALFYGALDPSIGWDPIDYDSHDYADTSRKHARIIVTMVSDTFRLLGEGQKAVDWYNAPANASETGGFGNPNMIAAEDEDWLVLRGNSQVVNATPADWMENGRYTTANYLTLSAILQKEQSGGVLNATEIATKQDLSQVFAPTHYDDLKDFDYVFHEDPTTRQSISTTMEFPELSKVGEFLEAQRIFPIVFLTVYTLDDETVQMCKDRYDIEVPIVEDENHNPIGVQCLEKWYRDTFDEAGIKRYAVVSYVSGIDVYDVTGDMFDGPLSQICDWVLETPPTTTTPPPKIVTTTETGSDSVAAVIAVAGDDEDEPNKHVGVIAGAVGGGVAGIAAVGALLWRKFGFLNKPSHVAAPTDEAVNVEHVTINRERMESVTMDMFR